MQKFCEFVGFVVAMLLIGVIVTFVYNNIALEFNLPNFDYWTCTGAYYIVRSFLKK